MTRVRPTPVDPLPARSGAGPVLVEGEEAQAVIAAIRAAHPDAEVVDRGSYLRVLVPGRCTVSRAAIERALGREFRFPGDLERLMPSFQGVLTIGEDQAAWASARTGAEGPAPGGSAATT